MIIDFHTHVDEAPAFGWLDPPEKIVGLLDEAGIDRAVIMTYTDLPGSNPAALDYITASAKRFPDRLVPFVRLNPSYTDEMPGILKRALQLGVKGVKLHPTTTIAHPAGAATVAVLRLCAEASLPVLFHCGDDPYTTPQALALAAALVPDCSIVMGHMGGYFHAADAIEANTPAEYVAALSRAPTERIWFDCGSEDRQVLGEMRSVVPVLRADGIDTRLVVRPGGHTFRVWRPALADSMAWAAPGLVAAADGNVR